MAEILRATLQLSLFIFILTRLTEADLGDYGVTSDSYPHHKVSRCVNSGVIPLNCPLDHVIQVLNLTYGVSEMGHCQPDPGDRPECMRPEHRSYGCSGKQTCTIRITEQTTYYYATNNCPHPTYITAHYVCVPVDDIDNICEERRSDDIKTDGKVEGYLSSPNYHMGSYYSNVDCLYTFQGRNVQLFFVSINLTDDYDCLTVEANVRSHTWCGGATVSENFLQTFTGNTFTETFRFRTGSSGHEGGFLLYYRYDAVPKTRTSAPPVTVVTPPLHEIVRTINLEPTTHHQTPPKLYTVTPKVAPLISQADNKIFSVYTLATILGMVFGIMGVVILLLGAVYYFTRRRQKKTRERLSLDRDQIVFHNMTNEVMSNILDKNNTNSSCFDNNSCENQHPVDKMNNRRTNLPSSMSIQQTFC